MESNQEFSIMVRDLIRKDLEMDERLAAVNFLTEEYIKAFDKKPPNGELALLTSYILKDDLSNTLSNKSSLMEYNFLSGRQLKRRVRDKEVFGLEEGDAFFEALISSKNVISIDDVVFRVDFNRLIGSIELTTIQRDILELLLVHNFTQDKIADELQITQQNVSYHLKAIRLKLQEVKN